MNSKSYGIFKELSVILLDYFSARTSEKPLARDVHEAREILTYSVTANYM